MRQKTPENLPPMSIQRDLMLAATLRGASVSERALREEMRANLSGAGRNVEVVVQ